MDRPFRGRYLMVDVAIVSIVGVLVVALGLSSSGSNTPSVGPPDTSITVEVKMPGRPVPRGFLGLSIEYPSLEQYAGSDPQSINPLFVQLIRNLAPGQDPALRIGGDSADATWWPVPGMAQPPGVTFTLTPAWMQVASALISALRAKVTFGINLEAGSPSLATAEATQLLTTIGHDSVRALELGNEPELYGTFAWYRTPAGRPVTGRPRGYDFNAFASDFQNFAAALPSAPLAGPTFGDFSWLGDLNQFLGSEHARLALVTLHRYPLQQCYVHPGSPRYPTISNLLSRTASKGLALDFASSAATVHSYGLRLRLDELNTVACGAAPAVSRSFASALWAVDTLFEMIHAGIDGVNIHTFPGAGYELFSFSHGARGWRAAVASEYYGLLMFASAAPAGSRLVAVSAPAGSPVRSWATIGPGKHIRVVLINDSPVRAHVVAVRVRGATAAATVELLQAPSLASTSGVTLGGQQLPAPGASASLTGTSGASSVTPHRGAYEVKLPHGSAALLTISTP